MKTSTKKLVKKKSLKVGSYDLAFLKVSNNFEILANTKKNLSRIVLYVVLKQAKMNEYFED